MHPEADTSAAPRPAGPVPRLYRVPARVAFLRFVARHKLSAAALAIALPFGVAVVGSGGCSGADEETEAPLVASAMPPPPVASVPLEDDAGAPDPESPDAAAKKKGPAVDPTGLVACCHALRNNAATAPDEQKEALTTAANVCDSVVKAPETRRGLIAVRGVLKGAKLPAECK